MTVIDAADVTVSVADALQYISYYHPPDYLRALGAAYEAEPSPAARDAMAQILTNSWMCAQAHRPICQDTGQVVVFARVGMDLGWRGGVTLDDMVQAGVRQAYGDPVNPLRASIVADPAFGRGDTRDNAPAVVHVELVAGDRLELAIAAKGAGSENKARFAMLNPGRSVADWVVDQLPGMGAGWCPPGMLGIGVGGSAEKAMLMAKRALMAPIDMALLKARGPATALEALRIEICDRVNALGIGAQGLGGLTTVLDVKVLDYPAHAASLPVALIPNCAATRHVEIVLDGGGPAVLEPPRPEDWPQVAGEVVAPARRVRVDGLTHAEVGSWRSGDRLLLSGRLLTARDAAHRRIARMVEAGEPLPDGLNLAGRVIYYVGPVDAVAGEAVGPAGPTTASRMDDFMPMMLGRLGVLATIGKAERGPEAVAAIHAAGAASLIAVGGAAYLVSKAIRSARVVAFPDLGMEAIHEFVVEDMPVTVAVDAGGASLHHDAPAKWRTVISNRKAAP